ncbi:hypothetical protein ACFL1W_00930, partial [Candidatus Margulisiibacteriota bacterium]
MANRKGMEARGQGGVNVTFFQPRDRLRKDLVVRARDIAYLKHHGRDLTSQAADALFLYINNAREGNPACRKILRLVEKAQDLIPGLIPLKKREQEAAMAAVQANPKIVIKEVAEFYGLRPGQISKKGYLRTAQAIEVRHK